MFSISSLFSKFGSFDSFRDIDFFNSSLSCSDSEIRQFNDVTSFLRNLEHCQGLYRYRKTKLLEYMLWALNDFVWKWFKKQTHFNSLSRFQMILIKTFSSQEQRELETIAQKRAKRKVRKIAKRAELNVIETAKQTSTLQDLDIFDSSLASDRFEFGLYSEAATFLQHLEQCQHLYRKSNLLNLLSKCLCDLASAWFKTQSEFISLKRFDKILTKAFSEASVRRASRSSNLQLSTLDVISKSRKNASNQQVVQINCKICKQSFNFNNELYEHIRNHEALKSVKNSHLSINATNLVCEIKKKSFVTHVSSAPLARSQKSIFKFSLAFETIILLKRSTLQFLALETTSESTKRLSVCRHCKKTFNFKKMFRQHKREQHAKKFVISSHLLLDAIKSACESMKISTVNTSFSVSFAVQSKQMSEFFTFFESIASFKSSFFTSSTLETICQFSEKSTVELLLFASLDTFNSARSHQDSEKKRFNQIVIFIQHLEQCQHLYCESELLEWMKIVLYDSVDIWFRNQSDFTFLHDFDIALTKTFSTFIFSTIFSSSLSISATESTCETSEKLVVMKSLDQFSLSQTFESEHQEISDQKSLNSSSSLSIDTVDSTCEVAERSTVVLFAKNAEFSSKRLTKIRTFAARIRVRLEVERTVLQLSSLESASKSMKRLEIQQIVCVRICRRCKQNFNFNNKFHEHIRQHHARKFVKDSVLQVSTRESAYGIVERSTDNCSSVSHVSSISSATSRSQIFSAKMSSRSISSGDLHLTIETYKSTSKSMKRSSIQEIVNARRCKLCKQNFKFNNKLHEHIREHHARKSVKSLNFRILASESTCKVKKKSTFTCSFVSLASFTFFATSKSIFWFASISESVSSKNSRLSIATLNITSRQAEIASMLVTREFTSKRVEIVAFNCSFISSRTSVSKHQKSYLIFDDLIRMFREKFRSIDLHSHRKNFVSSQHFDIRSSRQSFFSFMHQSRIIFYFMFAVNQKSSISQNSKNSKRKSLNQHMFAKSIRIVFSRSLSEKLFDLSCKMFDVSDETSFFIFIFLRLLSIFLLALAFVSIIFAARIDCINVYQQIISIIDHASIEFVASERNWEKTRNKLLEYSVTKHFQKRFIAYTFYWMNCTHRLSHALKYRCVNRCYVDSINVMKLIVSWYNRSEIFEDFQLFAYCRRSYSRKIVWIDHLSENSLRWCSVECNVHINSRICRNINALIVVTMILLTWSNCSSHRIFDLMLQEFNVRINDFITFKSSNLGFFTL